MASNKNRRSARNTSTGSNALGIQKKINSDYGILVRDYEKLFSEIWRKPATKYILGGAAFAAVVPFAMRLLGRHPELTSLVRENFDELRTRVEGVIASASSSDDSESTLNQ